MDFDGWSFGIIFCFEIKLVYYEFYLVLYLFVFLGEKIGVFRCIF